MKIINLIKVLILLPINLLVWYIVQLIPRKKNRIVYGAWFGERVSDNSFFLFKYGLSNKTDFEHFFITDDEKMINGINIISRKSIKAKILCVTANFSIISSGKEDLIPVLINGSKIINLWHGMPLKKICRDNRFIHNSKNELFKKIFLPHKYEYDFDFIVSSSKEFDDFICSAFNVKENQIIKSGYPRNIVYKSKSKSKYTERIRSDFPGSKIIFYLPTFRSNYNFNPFEDFGFDFSKFNKFLSENNFVFIYNFHLASDNKSDLSNNRFLDFKDLAVNDINLILNDVDILVTDYSSVMFDFLISGKKIILTPFDFNNYIKYERELYFNYHKFINCNIANNWDELFQVITKDEKLVEDKYTSYSACNSSKIIFDKIINLK